MSPGPQKQFDRDEVLERAMQLFWEEGYETTGVARLLEVVGIGRQSFYDTFGDKRSLFMETLDHYYATRVAPAVAQLRAPGSGLANIKAVFRRCEQTVDEDRFCGCMVGNTAAEQGRCDEEIAAKIAGYLRAFENALHDALRKARADGELPADLDPRDIARLIVTMIQGIALLGKVLKDKQAAKNVLRAASGLLNTA